MSHGSIEGYGVFMASVHVFNISLSSQPYRWRIDYISPQESYSVIKKFRIESKVSPKKCAPICSGVRRNKQNSTGVYTRD